MSKKNAFSLELPVHKKEFLEGCGFVLDSIGVPRASMGSMVRMDKWQMFDSINQHVLYIHFDSQETAYCNLYVGDNADDVEYFSRRNLVSEMKKRRYVKRT